MAESEAKDVKVQENVNPEATSQQESQNQAEVNSKEYNFAKLREKSEASERKNIELERQLNELKRQIEGKFKPQEEEQEIISDEDIITGAQARKLAKKEAEALIAKALAERERASLPMQTRSKYSDFDAIMTETNIKKLEQEEPGLADACSKAVNPWEATYKIIKKVITPKQEEQANKGDEKMKENLSKPASINSVGRQGPLGNANLWAKSSQSELYKEMIEASRTAR